MDEPIPTVPSEPKAIVGTAGLAPSDAPTGVRHRLDFIDALRGLAAMMIVAHHICTYGPSSDLAMELIPTQIDWVWGYGRLAVQVFFVISGFVTALTLSRGPFGLEDYARFVARRYVRLGFPYLATIVIMLTLTALVPARFSTFPLYDEISWQAMFSHILFLQDFLGYHHLSVGFWYLGIDFQFGLLFGLMILIHRALITLFRVRSRMLDSALLISLSMPWAIMSVFVWNQDPDHDIWLSYYFGSLYLGVICGWSSTGRVPVTMFWLYATVLVGGLIVEWRDRLALALAVGVLIHWFSRSTWINSYKLFRPLIAIGHISYSLFLIHYPTLWLVESVGSRLWSRSPWMGLLGMGVAFLASLGAAVVMFRLVEKPSILLSDRLRRSKTHARDCANPKPA